MKILGIGGQGYRDSSVAVVVDGRVVAAAGEGRFTRVKHQGGFPRRREISLFIGPAADLYLPVRKIFQIWFFPGIIILAVEKMGRAHGGKVNFLRVDPQIDT